MTSSSSEPLRVIGKLNLAGFVIIAVLIGGIGGWASTSELSGAVIASGSLVVETSIKKIQHASGGTIAGVLVDEGNAVEAGQVLVKLDDTIPRANLGTVRAALQAQLLREARLVAERDDAVNLTLPKTLGSLKTDPAVMQAFGSEERLFKARRATTAGQRAQLREQIAQLSEQVKGLEAQLEAKEYEIGLVEQELHGVSELFDKNLISVTKLSELRRIRAGLRGERGQLIASIAASRGKASEIELEILQLDRDFQSSVLNDLRDTEARISDLVEREAAAADQLRRVDIRAPQNGIVHDLTVHTVGGVIGGGETIMLIVPDFDALVAEAKIAPEDVDQVDPGAQVAVRILSGNRRTTPLVDGTVVRVSPDLLHEAQSGRPFYLARIELTADKSLADLQLMPGMPIEAYIRTEDRTPLGYLMKPLTEQVARAFRER